MPIPSANLQMGFFHATPNDFFGFFFGKVKMNGRGIYKILKSESENIPTDSLRKLASYVKRSDSFDSIPIPDSIFSGDMSQIPMLVRRLKRTGKRLVVYIDKRIRLDRPSEKMVSKMSSLAEKFGETLILAVRPKNLSLENFEVSLVRFLEIPASVRSCLAFVNGSDISIDVFHRFSRRSRIPIILDMGLVDRPSVEMVFRVWEKVCKIPHVIVTSYEHIVILKTWYMARGKVCHVQFSKN